MTIARTAMPWPAELDEPAVGVPVRRASPAPDDWYANLIWIDRHKCLLVVHADTLFPVFVANVSKAQFANFGQCILGTVATALAEEGIAGDCLGPLDPAQVRLARTASRSGLGVINDMASMSQRIAEQSSGINSLDVEDLKRVPCATRRTSATATSARSTPHEGVDVAAGPPRVTSAAPLTSPSEVHRIL